MSIETVDNSNTVVENPIVAKQKEDVAKMRTSLLSCSKENGVSTMRAIQDITVMRVYHQLTRIIRYTEMMDKLEDKLYSAMDYQIDNSDVTDPNTLMMLMGIQEKLQKAMIESHKLLQPYMDLQSFSVVDLVPVSESEDNPITQKLITSESRDKLRYAAQNAIEILQNGADKAVGGG